MFPSALPPQHSVSWRSLGGAAAAPGPFAASSSGSMGEGMSPGGESLAQSEGGEGEGEVEGGEGGEGGGRVRGRVSFHVQDGEEGEEGSPSWRGGGSGSSSSMGSAGAFPASPSTSTRNLPGYAGSSRRLEEAGFGSSSAGGAVVTQPPPHVTSALAAGGSGGSSGPKPSARSRLQNAGRMISMMAGLGGMVGKRPLSSAPQAAPPPPPTAEERRARALKNLGGWGGVGAEGRGTGSLAVSQSWLAKVPLQQGR